MLIELDIQSGSAATNDGTFDEDWLVIETSPTLIGAPTLSLSGIGNDLELFIDVKYRHEDSGVEI